jgi:cell division initiation protein
MITPLDVKQQTFGRALRGYDVDEVKAFLANLSREWENVLEENRKLKTELERVKDSLRTYKDMEAALHRTLQQAEQTAASTSEAAKREAEILLRETRQKAQDLIDSARRKYEEAEREWRELVYRRDGVAAELKTFLLAQLERLKLYEERVAAVESRFPDAALYEFPPKAETERGPASTPLPPAPPPSSTHPPPAPTNPPHPAVSQPPAPSPSPSHASPTLSTSVVQPSQPERSQDTASSSFFESALSPVRTPDFWDEI